MSAWIKKNKLVFIFGVIASMAIILSVYLSKYKVYGNSFDEISFLQKVAVVIFELPLFFQCILLLPISFIIPVTILYVVERYSPRFNRVAQYGGCLIQVFTYIISIILISSVAKDAIQLMTNIP